MAVRNEDWYAAQATRAYPLDDAATARDDAGLELPSQLLVDCRIRFPVTLGRFAYIGGMTVSPNIVTAVLMAAPDAARPPAGTASGGTAIQPLGAVSLPRPVTPNRHYPIQPMADGVGGWLVFGRGINDNEPYSGRFSTPGQSLLLPRVASAYHLLPIPSLGKLNVDPALTGVIQLLGATDLEVVQDTREVEGGIVDAIIIRLVDSLDRNVFSLYTGPCGGRPESQTCNTPVLQAINSVEPDCNGNLTIDFQGVNVIEFDGGGGLALDLALGMADVCLGQDYLPDDTGKLPSDYDGECVPPEPTEPPAVGGPPDQPPPAVGCVPIPYYESFDGTLPTPWTVVNGNFDLEADDSPGEPYGLEGPQSGLTPGQALGVPGLPPLHRARGTTAVPIVPINQSYASIDQSQRNVSIWDCPFYDTSGLPPDTLDMTCTTQLKLVAGPQINGGIIFNYFPVDPQFNNRPSYVLVSVNVVSGFLEMDVYNGQSITMSIGFPFGLNGHGGVGDFPVVGDWYQLLVRIRMNPSAHQTWLVGLHLSGVTNPAFRGIDVDQSWGWGPSKPLGRFGLGSNNAHCLFSWFQLEATPAGGPP
jgi:hypothetical protein